MTNERIIHQVCIETTGSDYQNIVKTKVVIIITNTSTQVVNKGIILTTNTSVYFNKESNTHKYNNKKDILIIGKTNMDEKYDS